MFGLCSKYGIETEGKTPRELWKEIHEAEERKKRETAKRMGVVNEDEATEEYTFGHRSGRKVRNSLKGLPEHNADTNYVPKSGYIAGAKAGRPMTHEEANGKRVNPFFDSEYSRLGYVTNCAMCVAAYEARRRGFNVRALPFQYKDIEISLSEDVGFAFIEAKHLARKGESTKSFVDGNVKDGQRYILGFDIPKSRERHVIIAFREKGDLKLYDPQNGETYSGRAMWSYLADKSKLRLTRVDDLDFNSEVINYIVKEVK